MLMEVNGKLCRQHAQSMPVNLLDFLRAAALSYRNGGKDSEILYSSYCPTYELMVALQLYHSTDGE